MTLLAANTSTTSSPFSGTHLIADGQALSAAMKNGNWLDGGIAFLQGLGDAAAALTDPIGTLVNCGLGWVMSHLAPLSTWLNQLAGSAQGVQTAAGQWTQTGSTMRNAGSTLATRLKDLDGMKGSTVTAYLAFAKDAAEHLHASGDWADAVSHGLTTASDMVSKMQSVVKKAISSVIATAIEAMAVVAASFGLGMGYAIARVVTKVNEMVNKVAKPILSVLKSAKSLVSLVQSFHQLFEGTGKTVDAMLNAAPAVVPVDVVPISDVSIATSYADTEAASLQAAAIRIEGDKVAVDGPIAGGSVHFNDLSGIGGGGAGIGAGGAGGAGSVSIGAGGSLGGAGSVNAGTIASGGMMGGTALTAARMAGVSTGGAGANGAGQVAGARTGGAPAGDMGARSTRRGRRLTVDIVPDEDDAEA
jgi:hypothetical protein